MKPHLKIGFAMIILAFGCKKYEVDSNTTNVPGQTSEVPNDFSWTTTQDLQTRFQFDSELTSKTVTFELLDQNFNRIYKLYKESGKSSMAIDQIVSNQLDSFYFYAPQISVFSKHPITANNITISEPTAGIRGNYVPPARNTRSGEKSGCITCDQTLSNGSGNQNFNSFTKVCVTGNYSGSFTFNQGGEISVCGTLTMNNLNINGGTDVDIIVNGSGTLIVNNMNMNGNGSISSEGQIIFNNTYSVTTPFHNIGSTYAKSTLNFNTNSLFINDGEVQIDGHSNHNDDATNNGSMYVKGDIKVNSGCHFINNCSLETEKEFHVNDNFDNYGFIKAGTISYINGGGDLHMAHQTLLKTRDIHLNSPDVTSDGTGVIAISGNTTINSSFDVDAGFIDICDANGIETNNANAATLSHLKFCVTSVSDLDPCFGEGHTVAGGGGGAIAGSYNYPSSGFAWRAIEDLWPAKGDYDFNDMVIKYNYEATTNGSNDVTEITFDITLPALGAAHQNGMALQLLRKAGNNYSRVTGGVFTSSQTGVTVDPLDPDVIIISESIFQSLPQYYRNVGDGADGITPYNFQVTVQVKETAQVDATDLVADLFLFRVGRRGLEIHLPGLPPSAAVDQNIFGSIDDDSYGSGWYKTTDNYPWGVEIINTSEWKHPLSTVRIWNAYPEFNGWISSGGDQNQSWFNNPTTNLVYQLL